MYERIRTKARQGPGGLSRCLLITPSGSGGSSILRKKFGYTLAAARDRARVICANDINGLASHWRPM